MTTGSGSTRRPLLARGVCVGRYVLLDTIGEGGMGIVYKAYDPELERPVALKLVHTDGDGGSSISTQRDRLLREAKALARLSHPNVLAVYDVGPFEDDVFIATEFIEGKTLGAWLRDTPRSRAEILRAFFAAGEGLAAAHRAELVHRDFKPANVIVGKDGRVRVLDFGLARAGSRDDAIPPISMPLEQTGPSLVASADEATVPARVSGAERPEPIARTIPGVPSSDPSLSRSALSSLSAPSSSSSSSTSGRSPRSLLESPLTEVGQVVGTPRFMAPEQHRGQAVDARSDQFSFCVTLYEALYGELPFDGSRETYAANVIRGKVRSAPPKSDVPRWLRQIVLRGLSLAPADRYPSMDALLADLKRDPSVTRRRAFVAVSAAVLVIAGALAIRHAQKGEAAVCQGASHKLAGVWDDARREGMHASFVASGSAMAEDAYRRSAGALDEYTGKWVSMHGDACEATRIRGEQSAELLDLRMECLSERLEEAKAQVAVLTKADAKMVEKAVQAVRALPSIDGCADVAALRAPIRPPNDPLVKARVEAVRGELAGARALQRSGKYVDAMTIASRVAALATETGYRPVEAEALYLYGDLEDDNGDYPAAEHTLRRAAAAAIAGSHDVFAARALDALVVEIGLRQARFAEAHEWVVLAEAATERIHDPFVRGELPRNVGRLLYREGKYAESHASIARCLSIWEPALGHEDLGVAGALTDIGNVSFAEGHYEEAIAKYTQSIAIQDKILGPDHPYLAPNLNNLGEVMTKLGEYEQAEISLNRALALWERAFGPEHPKVALALYNRGQTANGRGDYAHAQKDAERALSIWRKAHGEVHPDVALGLHGVAEVLRAEGKYDEALARHEQALAIREKVLGADHVDLAYTLVGIGEVRLAQRKPLLALPPLTRALALREAHPGDAVELGDTRFALARALRASGGDASRVASLVDLARASYAAAQGPLAKTRGAELATWIDREP